MAESNAKGKSGAVPKPGSSGGANGRGEAAPEAAFDLWLQRGLHQLFDDVMREPIPEELLRLIEQDRGQG
ncbi:NepR family anti-sigma factor [Roseomonas populi]|uniref:NepR family anti-sigma factor n=1 Tax=Roseomonas populi TaxID=3121582 RepID=A0ABT1XBE3_9PROT|nr:NepR family anti-sigma factor [Roseomonas pecuniae]MCR0984319.1 NepR family anti-sigma factor [Roseomonas pecuniae]